MTHGESLVLTVEATQRALDQRLGAVLASHNDRLRPRDVHAATDAFLAATSRHLAAVQAVVLGDVRRAVPDGEAVVHAYLEVSRDLEQTLSLIKARLYGEAHAIHLSWSELWRRAGSQLAEHNRLETDLVDALVRHGDPEEVDGLARKVFDAESRGPTRPHPVLPHTGLLSLVTRKVWAVADRFWDAVEGRVIPDPVRPRRHRHDSLLAQYLVADPKFDDHATVIEHRRKRRHSGTE